MNEKNERRSFVPLLVILGSMLAGPIAAANPQFGTNPVVFTRPSVVGGEARVSVVEPREIALENGLEIRDLSYTVTEALPDADGTVRVEWVAEREFEIAGPVTVQLFEGLGAIVADTSSTVGAASQWTTFHAEVFVDGTKATGCEVPLSSSEPNRGEEEIVIPVDCDDTFRVSLEPGTHSLEYRSGVTATGLAPTESPGNIITVSVYRATLDPAPVLEVPTVTFLGLALLALLVGVGGVYLLRS